MKPANFHFGPWGVTAILSLCFVMSYVDRLVLGLLVEPIKAAIHGSDIEMGLLFGAAFGVVYAFAGLPLGALVDRGNRKWLAVSGLTIWSVLTIAAGFATALPLLFVCRFGLAIGEAALSPSGTSMISDLFAPKRRAFPISIFFASGMVGAGGAFVVGGAVVAAMTALIASGFAPSWAQPWRLTFMSVGLLSLTLAVLMALFVREPVRTGMGAHGERADMREIFSLVGGRWWGLGMLFLSISFVQIAVASIAAWAPTILQRDYGYSIAQSGLKLGLAQLMTAPTGQIAIGALASFMFRRQRRGVAFAIVCGASLAATTLSFALMPLAHDADTLLVLLGVAMFFGIGICSLSPVAVGLLMPNRLRGSAIALYYLAVALLGVALGPVVIPWLASYMPSGPGGLTHALAIAGVGGGLVSLLFSGVAAFALRRIAPSEANEDSTVVVDAPAAAASPM